MSPFDLCGIIKCSSTEHS